MIDTDPLGPNEEGITVEVKRDYEDDSEPESSFYVEKASGYIYEVRFFPDFALVRPAHPDYASALERLDLLKFSQLFDLFHGDIQVVKDFMWGAPLVDSIEVEKIEKK